MKKICWILAFLITIFGGWILYKEINRPQNIFEEMYKVETHDFAKNDNKGLISAGFKRYGKLEQFDEVEGRFFYLKKIYNKTDDIEYDFHTFEDEKSLTIIYETKLDSGENLKFEYTYSLNSKKLTKNAFFSNKNEKYIDVHSKLAKKYLSKYQLSTQDIDEKCDKIFKKQVVNLWINTYKNTRFTKNNIGKFK